MRNLGRLAAGIFAGAIVTGLVLGAAAPAAAQRMVTTGVPICPLLALTGIPCPFCGMTRATIALGSGDLGRAFQLHPLAPFVLVAVFALAVLTALGRGHWMRARGAPPLLLSALGVVWLAKLLAG